MFLSTQLLSELPLLHSAILKTKATANELSNTCLTLPILKDFSHYAKYYVFSVETKWYCLTLYKLKRTYMAICQQTLLTAGSLVRVQQGEPKRAGRHQSSCSFSLYLLTQTVDPATHSRTAVNWLGAPRCLRQMKRCSEQEETTSIAKRSKRARRLCFWPYALLVSPHLRCMKNEVASLMKCGKPHENQSALYFMWV